MTVDEDYLEYITRTLNANATACRDNADKMEAISNTFTKIALVDGKPQIDSDTGQPITQARRDEIYDKCLPVAKQLLEIPDETNND